MRSGRRFALTARFLALCQQYGSEQLAVSIVAAGTQRRGAGVAAEQRLDGVERGRDARGDRASAAQARYPSATSMTWGT